ncbi:helix-turn-helix transcriptional regulator [Paenibacillus sp. IB182496]|uniref:Helix-turn-helix transcriptional regulator n=1 Tax=Paenibacillus sabuli TaxID=2772509 RepID=A0A927BW49_9BACL|nr:helix-turn-helix transcriptional regulator [Paenibacillus sabuli]
MRRILRSAPVPEAPPAAGTDRFPAEETLTRQERRVLRCLLEGADNRQIATALAIAVETVKRHCRNLYRKLDVQNRKQLAERYAGAPSSPG